MAVKLANSKLKTENSWRDDEALVRIRDTMAKHARKAEERLFDIKEEVIRYQKTRIKNNVVTYEDVSSRGLKGLMTAIARDKSFRSNIAGLQIEVLDEVNYYKEKISLARRKITSGAYGVQLRKEYKTVAAQRDAIEHYFSAGMKIAKQGDFVIKLIDIVITDIDQSAFNDQRLLRGAELIFHPGRAD